MDMSKKQLTGKQLRFVDEYLFDLNKTRAAIRSGYAKNNASSVGARLYNDRRIRTLIDDKIRERSKRTDIDSDYVLQRLGDIDQLDIIDILDEHGNFLPLRSWPRVWRISIAGFDVATVGTGNEIDLIKKIKWPDKVKNLEMIGRHTKVSSWGEKEDGPKSTDGPQIYIVKLPDNGR